jgi:hypothetical protein
VERLLLLVRPLLPRVSRRCHRGRHGCGGGWIEDVLEEGTDDDFPAAAAMTTTVTPPAHAGEKRTHEQQQALHEQAAGVPPRR